MAIAAASAQPGAVLMPAQLSNGTPGFQLVKMAPGVKICLTKQLADESLPYKLDPSAYCKSILAEGVQDNNTNSISASDDRPTRLLIIKLRSVSNVFEFLGAVVNLQNKDEPKYIKIVSDTNLDPKASKEEILSKTVPLLMVNKGTPKVAPLVSVKYQGDEYSIPKDSLSYSNQVLVLLSQMLTLTKVPGSIPLSPSVLIR
jgi:hypothetical protein